MDYGAIADDLRHVGAQFFGAHWCGFCARQKQAFGSAAERLPYVESSRPDGSPNQVAIDEGITSFPTWRFQGDYAVVESALARATRSVGRSYSTDAIEIRKDGFQIVGHLDPVQLAAIADSLQSDNSATQRSAVAGLAPAIAAQAEPQGESLSNPWRNGFFTFDVNGDGSATALDALNIINYLNDNDGGGTLPAEGPDAVNPRFYDVSGDGSASALDALRVINELNVQDERLPFLQGISAEDITEFKDQFIFWEDDDPQDVEYLLEISTQANCRGDFVFEQVVTDVKDIEVPNTLDVGEFFVCLRVRTAGNIVRPVDNNALEFRVVGVHHVFVTSVGFHISANEGRDPDQFGNPDGADFICTSIASGAGLVDNWDGESIVWKAVISDANETAFDRLDTSGPFFNLGGERLAVDKEDFFDNDLENPITFDQDGDTLSDNQRFWHGSTPNGRSNNSDCNGWDPSGGTADVGSATTTNWFTGAIGGGACVGSSESLACVSPLQPPRN